MSSGECYASLDYDMQVSGDNFINIPLPSLDDGVMHYFPSSLQEYLGVHIS